MILNIWLKWVVGHNEVMGHKLIWVGLMVKFHLHKGFTYILVQFYLNMGRFLEFQESKPMKVTKNWTKYPLK